MKNFNLPESGSALSTMKKTMVLFLSASLMFAGCRKDSDEIPQTSDGAGAKEEQASTSATPTGSPTVTVYPVRGPHNHGWNSGLTSTGPYTCDRQYSNEDFIAGDHYGNDIFAAVNTPIVSPVNGVLVTVVNTTNNGLGRHVYIKQSNGWHHVLGHLNSLTAGLAVGQTVTAGQSIGKMGATGTNSGGSVHLHYSINHGPGLWSTGIDPFPYTYPVELNVCSTPSTLPVNGKYKIIAKHTGKAVAVLNASMDNLAQVVQWDYSTGGAGVSTNDEWNLTNLGGNKYKIINVLSGKALKILQAGINDGDPAIQYDYTTGTEPDTSDEWTITDVGGGYWKIINVHSLKGLNVSGPNNGDVVRQWTYQPLTNMHFQLTKL